MLAEGDGTIHLLNDEFCVECYILEFFRILKFAEGFFVNFLLNSTKAQIVLTV